MVVFKYVQLKDMLKWEAQSFGENGKMCYIGLPIYGSTSFYVEQQVSAIL